MRTGLTAWMRMPRSQALLGLGLVIALGFAERCATAQQFQLDFDSPEPSWQVRCRPNEARLDAQERLREGALRVRSEFVRVRIARENTPLRLEHKLPAMRVLDELTVSLWYRSDRPGAVLALRISFRDTKDPATGVPLSMIISGDKYETEGKWQQLSCRTSDKAVNQKLRLLRAEKKLSLDAADMYIDQVILGCQFSPGMTEMLIDDLELNPMIPMDAYAKPAANPGKESSRSRDDGIKQTAMTSESEGPAGPAEIRLHRLKVEGRPFFPRVIPYRQERPEVLAAAGFNATWIADLESIANTGQFRERGIWLTTTPPFAKGAGDEPLDSDDASLLPFAQNTSPVLFWMLGARLTGDSRPRLASWANQIRDADRRLKRPLAADVADDERIASRHLDLIGLSRHVMNTGLSLPDYRDEIMQRRDRAWPGSFCFTWIQTEPAKELMDLNQVTDVTPVLEPEQIRLQVYAALAAGCRGIGFWTTTPLDAETPGARERLLAITQLNLELELLEPWLATGSTVQLVPFNVETNQTIASKRAAATAKSPAKTPEKKPEKNTPAAADAQRRKERQLSAAMIRTEFGAILLPMWLEERSHFVPAQLAAYTATVIVPGGGDTATVWEITTTGRVQNLNRETVTGGIKIEIPKFDQTAAILVTSDPSIVDRINPRIAAIQERSANATVELCRLKLDRVRAIDDQLVLMGIKQPRGAVWLDEARQFYEKADAALKQQQYQAARRDAGIAMQSLRILQRAHWDEAVAKMQSPLISPFAVCFQTLPAHWKLMRNNAPADLKGDSKTETAESRGENKLLSSDFEDLDTLIAAGWRHEQRSTNDIRSTAELHPSAKQGKFSLRLAAEPTVPEPAQFDFYFAPVSIVSPAVAVHAGQLVKISGWVKTPHQIVRSMDGALIYDSLMGKTGAVRIVNATDWQRFEMWRPVVESQQVTLSVEMHGLGEVLIDDLRITTATLPADLADAPKPGDPPIKPVQHSPLERFDLRRLSPLKRQQ